MHLTLDMANHHWNFSVSKADLSQVNNSDGLDLSLTTCGSKSTAMVPATQKTTMKYSQKQ